MPVAGSRSRDSMESARSPALPPRYRSPLARFAAGNLGVTPHIGLVGCGNWGRYILRDLKGLGCRVTVVAVSPQTRQNAEFAADHILDSVEEFGAGVDGFVVATPTSLHAETVTALLRFRRPIFCEKPLANNLDAARLLVQTGGDRIFVMDKWRYHPG